MYESTGSKTRINQVIVTWVNPDSSYKAEPLIVEDRLNIAETGKIISQTAVAMGATSEGQAMRYGRWKLWTAANQREVVTFSSALNSSFISPGDVVNVQDPNRFAVRLGGRVSNSGTTRTTSSIPLDSPTGLNSGSEYELSVLFTEPAAFATSDITIAGVTYSPGDLIKQAYITGNSNLQNIDTEEKASNARASSGATEALVLAWTDTTRVETKTVDSTRGLLNTISIKTSGNDANGNPHTLFASVPEPEAIWVLTETAGGATVSSSSKQYKILAISESSKGEMSFTGAEHYDEKFKAVDEDFTTFIADTVYPVVTDTDIVPPPVDVFCTTEMKPESVGEELIVSWTPPSNVGSVPGEYEHLHGYEITHTFPGVENPVRISDAAETSWSVDSVQDGTYGVAVRTINTRNNLSEATRTEVTVDDRFRENIPRLPEGVPYTGTVTVGFELLGDVFKFKRYTYSATGPNADSAFLINTNGAATAWQQNCSTLPEITWTEADRGTGGEFIKEHAYILLDASASSDKLKLIKYYRPALSTPFWYDVGTGNVTNKYTSALTGTVSKPANATKITGSGTAFLTQVQAGDVLKLSTTEGYKVAAVLSDTVMYVTNSFGSYSNVAYYVPNLRIDYSNDVIIARVYNTSGGLILAETYAKVDSELKFAGDIIQEDGVTVAEIDTSSETGGTFGAVVSAINSQSFESIDTNVLNANSVIAREVQVYPPQGTPPTINGTTLAGAGIDLKQDGDLYVGDYSANKYLFYDHSEGVMTFRGTLNLDDIVGSSATFSTLMAEVATIGTLNTKMLDSDAIVTRDIRVGPSAELAGGSFVVGTEYYITELNNTTQAQWNTTAGTSGTVYNIGSIFTASTVGAGTGKARNRTTVAKIAGANLTGSGAHLNAAGDFYVGNAANNEYMFWHGANGTLDIRGQLNADDIVAGTIDADKIDVDNLSSINANIGAITAGTIKGDTMPDADAAPSGAENGAFLDLTGGKMVFGNANKFILWDGTDLTISGVTINAAQLTGSTGFATAGYVDQAITDLVGTANSNLDTLGEIATALNNDAALNTTLTTAIATKLPKAGGQMTGNITFSSTQTVDGRDLSVDGAKLDAISAGATNTAAPYYTGAIAVGDGGLTQKNFTTTLKNKLDGVATGATNTAAPHYTSAIAVGDGGLTQKNFTTTLKNKLDGVATGATNTAAPHYTSAIAVGDGGLTQKNFTTILKNKLDTVAPGATQTAAPYYTGAIPNATASTTGLMTSTFATKLNGIAAGATNVTNNNQLTNGEGYITNADDGDAATFGGSLPSAYVTTDHLQALGSQANAMTNSGSTVTLRRGDGSTDVVTLPNTTYSVGDGGLTQKNFTTTLKNKLDGVAASATNTAAPHYTSAIAVGDGGLTQKNFTTTLKNKLDGVAASATNTAAPHYTSAIAVGDGGLTQKNFTTTLKNKLDGVAASATNTAAPYYTSAIAVGAGGLTQQNFTTTLKNKLDGVAASANNYSFPYTISQSAGGGTVVRRHNDGYIFANYFNTTPNTVTSGVTQVCVETGNDGYIRHGTAAAIRTFINVADGANNFVHPAEGVDMGAALTGANVLSDVAVNANGHVTGFTSRALTLGNLGYTGATNANYITSNNQLTNDEGYISSYINTWNANTSTVPGYVAAPGTGANQVWKTNGAGQPAWRPDVQGVTTVQSGTGVDGIIVSGGTGATATLSLHANLEQIADADQVATLAVDFLEAGTINANHITANTIDAGKMTIGQTGLSSNRMLLQDTCLKIFEGNTLRVHIGDLSNTTT